MRQLNRFIFLLLLHTGIAVLFSTVLPAQTPTIDSLRKVLDTNPKKDTNRVNTYILLFRAYLMERNDLRKIEESMYTMFELARKLNYKKGLAYGYLDIGLVEMGKSNYEQAIYNYTKSMRLMQETGNKKGLASCYQNIGNVKNNQGKYEEALEFSMKSVKIREEMNDKQMVASGYNNIALTYSNLGNYQKALEYHFKSLRLKEEVKDRLGISISYINIGNVFEEQKKYNESMDYQKKALVIKIEMGDKEGEAMVYNNMANSLMEQNKYMEALAYHLKSLKLREEIGDQQGISMSYINIGNTYRAQDKVNEALEYYLKGVKLSGDLGDEIGIINAYNGAGNCYEKKKNYESAKNYYDKALQASEKTKYKIGIRDAYSNLSSVCEHLENYEQALNYNKLFTAVKDSMLNEESLKQTSELNTRYETDKKEKEILLLTKDQQLKDKTLKEQRLVRIGLLIGLGLFLALSFLLFNRYRFKQKANVLLEKQKQEIHQKNVLITDSIDYAKTIQEAILPDDERLTAFFPDHFILYKPKAIVSGDFYWIGKKDNKIICAVADCTGHGVPGAFMSLLGHNILENVIQRDTANDPGSMLTALNEEIVTRFSKGKERETVKHGMDIALISIDHAKQYLQYAGARNSLYLVRENVLTEIKADKRSTGVEAKDHSAVTYTTNNCNLQTGDMLYMFSDGFADQNGGPDKKKFFYQPFKELLTAISKLPVKEQKQKLDETIINWIGNGEQIDDILIMGISIGNA